jgi:hypothetical protein
MAITFDEAANTDIYDAYSWNEKQWTGLGNEFLEAIGHALNLVVNNRSLIVLLMTWHAAAFSGDSRIASTSRLNKTMSGLSPAFTENEIRSFGGAVFDKRPSFRYRPLLTGQALFGNYTGPYARLFICFRRAF